MQDDDGCCQVRRRGRGGVPSSVGALQLREVKEGAGLAMTRFRFRGPVTFDSDEWGRQDAIRAAGAQYVLWKNCSNLTN